MYNLLKIQCLFCSRILLMLWWYFILSTCPSKATEYLTQAPEITNFSLRDLSRGTPVSNHDSTTSRISLGRAPMPDLDLNLPLGPPGRGSKVQSTGTENQQTESTFQQAVAEDSWPYQAYAGERAEITGHEFIIPDTSLRETSNYAFDYSTSCQCDKNQVSVSKTHEPHLPINPTDFWNPKTAKVMIEVKTSEGTFQRQAELDMEAIDNKKLAMKYPEEKILEDQLATKPQRCKLPFGFVTDGSRKKFEKYRMKHFVSDGSHKNFKKKPKKYSGSDFDYAPRAEVGAPGVNRLSDSRQLFEDALQQGKAELGELGLPITLCAETFLPVPQTMKQKLEQRYSALPHNVAVEVKKFVQMANEKGEEKFKKPEHTATISVETLSKNPISPTCLNSIPFTPILKKYSLGLHRPGPVPNTSSPEERSSAPATLSPKKMGLLPTFDVAKIWISYSFPVAIHKIRVLCAAFPHLLATSQKTVRQFQWGAWCFYHTLLNNIEKLHSPESGVVLWEKKGGMKHLVVVEIINHINKAKPYEQRAVTKASPIVSWILALWLSHELPEFYNEIRSGLHGGLNGCMKNILNGMYLMK